MAVPAATLQPVRDLALCLAFSTAPAEIEALRTRLYAGNWEPMFDFADRERLLPALAAAVETKGLAAGIPIIRRPGGRGSIPAVLADEVERHHVRSAELLDRLTELLALFSAHGIEAVLLKGARALWTGTPPWRTLRDLDLLIPQPQTAKAEELAMAAGYHTDPDYVTPDGWHHGADLYRDDLPGWLELHARAGVHRAELILPTAMLAAEAVPVARAGGRTARVLPPALHILHCLTHHHIGHRGDFYGLLDFKGLFEFAADVDGLDLAGREDLFRTAARHPRLLALLDLWLAAAADTFRLPVHAPLVVAEDACRHWQAIVRRAAARAATAAPPGRFDGLAQEAQMGLSAPRLRRLPGGSTVLGRLRLRWRMVKSIAARAVAPDAAGRQEAP